MEVISWKNMPIFTKIILLWIRHNTIPYGHKSDNGWQLSPISATSAVENSH